jgi:hypothetical protein
VDVVAAAGSAAAAVREKYLEAVGAAHRAETGARSRPPHRLGISKLGGCARAAAYTLAGTPASNQPTQTEGRAANHGTWLHEGLLPRLANEVGGKHETDVVARIGGLEIMGRADLAVVDSDDGGEVADVKTLDGLDAVRRWGGYEENWVQVMAYILGKIQETGRRIRWAVLIYVDRGSGEVEVFVREATDAALLAVVARVGEIHRWAADPDTAPRTTAALPGGRRWRLRGPGLSWACNECWWLSRCWPGAVPGVRGAQANLVRSDPAREAALGAYAAASAAVGDATTEKDFWRSVLDNSPEGVYGRWRLSWTRAGSIKVTAVRPLEEAS